MRMVLLRHDLPDGSSHFDWMVEPSDPGRGLVSFRVHTRIDHPEITRFEAERIGEHRRDYLSYEGPVSGGRGVVTRVANGDVTWLTDLVDSIVLQGHLGGARGTWRGLKTPEAWRFERQEASPGETSAPPYTDPT